MRVQWAVACICIAIVVIHTGAKAADRDMPPAAVGSAVSVPSLTSESAFADYQPFRDEKLRSWKDANQVVADNPGMGSMGAMKGMPGMKMPAGEPMQQSHGKMAMAKPPAMPARPDSAAASAVSGTGTVQGVDKANSRVKLTHDPIAALGWPKMTMFFKLKDGALADRIKEGDSIEFSLEKSTSGYVISDVKKRRPEQ